MAKPAPGKAPRTKGAPKAGTRAKATPTSAKPARAQSHRVHDAFEGNEPPGAYLRGNVERRVNRFPDRFADASASFKDARFVLAGLPYDETVSFRYGAALAPSEIRQASWNLEPFNVRNGVDLADVPMHDMGDLDLAGLAPEKMFEVVKTAATKVAKAGKFPLFVGGEHSTIPPIVHALHEQHAGLKVLQLDAHLDYRREYHGSRENHACAMRRIGDAVGAKNMAGIGIRSVDKEEHAAALADGFRFWTSHDVHRVGIGRVVHEALDHLGPGPLYVTLDIDALDPAYAPATGTPEPFGLTPQDVLNVIMRAAPRLVGFDINEVSPPWDSGNTAALAARLARETIAEAWLARGT